MNKPRPIAICPTISPHLNRRKERVALFGLISVSAYDGHGLIEVVGAVIVED